MKALIVGANGQDGKLLTEYLQQQQVDVIGIDKNSQIDLTDAICIEDLITKTRPDQIFYLAACNKSAEQVDQDSPTDLDDYINIQSKGLHNFLYAIRKHQIPTRLFYAASSLVYGNYNSETLIDENTAFAPACFYGITKTFGISLCRMYREKYGVFAVSGILFNHESEHRKPYFLTKKIVQTAVQIKLGQTDKLILGALDNIVDWSHAEDFICAFDSMLKSKTPNDYIIASGQGHTIRQFVEIAFSTLDLDWQKYVTVKQDFIQRNAVTRIGNSYKLKTELGWQPKYTFKDMILDLVNKELTRVKNATK